MPIEYNLDYHFLVWAILVIVGVTVTSHSFIYILTAIKDYIQCGFILDAKCLTIMIFAFIWSIFNILFMLGIW